MQRQIGFCDCATRPIGFCGEALSHFGRNTHLYLRRPACLLSTADRYGGPTFVGRNRGESPFRKCWTLSSQRRIDPRLQEGMGGSYQACGPIWKVVPRSAPHGCKKHDPGGSLKGSQCKSAGIRRVQCWRTSSVRKTCARHSRKLRPISPLQLRKNASASQARFGGCSERTRTFRAHWRLNRALGSRTKENGSSGRTRTYNPPVNSRMLCH